MEEGVGVGVGAGQGRACGTRRPGLAAAAPGPFFSPLRGDLCRPAASASALSVQPTHNPTTPLALTLPYISWKSTEAPM